MKKVYLLLLFLLFSYLNGNAFSFFYAKDGVFYLCSSDKMKAEVIAYLKNKPNSDLTDSEGQYLFWCEDDFDYTSYINEYNNKYRDSPHPPSTISRSPTSKLDDEITIPSSIHAYTIVQSSDKKTVSQKYAGTYLVVGIGNEAFKNRNRPQSLTISDGIEYIGYRAFYKPFGSGLEKLYLPNTLKKIGSDAFCYCDIQTITIPKSLKECGSGVFANCEKLKTADVQCNFVPFAIFWECKNLEEVTLSDKTITIGSDAFYYCENLRSVNPVLKRENGEVYWENVLPSGIKTIYYGAFKNCHSLETIELPLYLDSLGHRYTETENGHGWIGRVFEYCKNLKRVTFHKTLKYIGHDSFSNCTALEEVIVDWDEPIEGEKNIFSNIIARNDTTNYIYEHATLVIRNTNNKKYREVSPWMYFKTHSHPGGIVHDDTVTLTAKNYTRQYGNANPTFEYEVSSGTIKSGEPTITCSATTTSPVGTYDIVIAKGTVSNSSVELVKGTLTITKAPLTISAGNYNKVEGEDNPTFKATYSGFKNSETEAILTKKPTITTTATKTSPVGSYPVTVSGADAQNYAITYQNGTLTITEKSTGDNSLQVGDTFTTNGMSFIVTSISPNEVQIGKKEPGTPAINQNTEGAVSIPLSVLGSDGNNYSVTSIGACAFEDCKNVTEIKIPESIKTIGNSAFSSCSMLTGITIPESVTTIGEYAFFGCTKLTGINIPKSVTTIGKYAFYHCDSFTSITIPSTVSTWGEYVFGHCDLLSTVIISDGVTSIGESLFDSCANLTSVTIPSTVATIGKCAFADCNSLTNIALPKGVKTINEEAFGNCSSLTNVVLPEGLTTIADEVFFRCSSLTSINIPSSVTYIGGAFNQCPALAEVHITDMKAWCSIEFKNNTTANPLVIAQHLYLNGKEVKDLVIPEGTTKIGKYAFYRCNSLTSVTIPAGVTDFEEMAFGRCEGLTSVTSASSIGYRAFANCINLTNVTLLKGVEKIGARSFSYCEALTKINIEDIAAWCAIEFGDNPLAYAHHLFMNGKEVKELVIPEGVTTIKPSAFNGCEGLTSVTIPTTVTSIGDMAFTGCTGLEEVHSEIKEPFSIKASTFSSETYTKPLYVPNGTKAKYEATSGWKNFKNIIEMEDTGISGVKLCDETYDVYNLQGRKIRHEATSLDGLPKGVYIINGRKVVK